MLYLIIGFLFAGWNLLPADHGLVQLDLLSDDHLLHRTRRHLLDLW